MLTNNDLLVLGLLLDKPMHGYEIAQHIKEARLDVWLTISTSAIYYSLSKLHQCGLVSETQFRSGGSERSLFHTTESGRDEFFAGMEALLASGEPYHSEYDLGIYLLNKLPQTRVLALLEKRRAELKDQSRGLESTIAREHAEGQRPLQLAIVRHALAATQMEVSWLAGIIAQLQGQEPIVEGARDLMLLRGDLQDFHLPDLVKLIISGEHSGTLTITDGVSTRTLSFREGQPVCATSSRGAERVEEARRVENDIYDLFRWQEGRFSFDQSMAPETSCVPLRMDARNLILRGARWVDNWVTIQRVVPGSDSVFERRPGVDSAVLDLNGTEEMVLDRLDGLSDVASIALSCRLTEFETSKVLYGLHVAGLLQPGDRDKNRLRRVFREFAELTCGGTRPFRAGPDDLECEELTNRSTRDLPVCLNTGRIEDRTDPRMRPDELAQVYRAFLQTQQNVVSERFGQDVADRLRAQVQGQISPGLREVLAKYSLL